MGVYGCHGHLWVMSMDFYGFLGVDGCIWVTVGVDRFLGIFGCL